MEGEDLATDSREGLTCSTGSHGTSVMWLQKGMCSGQLYLYPEWSEVHQLAKADFLRKEDDDNTIDLYNDFHDSDDDDESDDSETEDSY